MTSATESEIRELEEQVKQADVVTDPELLDRLLIDGFTFAGQDGKIYTKEHILQAHRPAAIRKFKRFETSDLRINALEDAAVVTVHADFATEKMQIALLFTRFWLKRAGRWQIVGGSAIELGHSHDLADD